MEVVFWYVDLLTNRWNSIHNIAYVAKCEVFILKIIKIALQNGCTDIDIWIINLSFLGKGVIIWIAFNKMMIINMSFLINCIGNIEDRVGMSNRHFAKKKIKEI